MWLGPLCGISKCQWLLVFPRSNSYKGIVFCVFVMTFHAELWNALDDKRLDSFGEVSKILLHQNPVTSFKIASLNQHPRKKSPGKADYIFLKTVLGVLGAMLNMLNEYTARTLYHHVSPVDTCGIFTMGSWWDACPSHGQTRHFHGFFDPPRIWSIARAGPLHRKMPSIKSAHVISPWPAWLEKPFSQIQDGKSRLSWIPNKLAIGSRPSLH